MRTDIVMPVAVGKPASALMTKGKEKKLRRVAEVRAHKEVMSKRRDAASRRDLLQNYAAFKRFSRQGVEAMLEGVHGVDLSDEDVDACIALQCANLSGAAEGSWDEASARQALRHDESRVLLMHGPLPVAMPATTEAAEVEEVDVGDEWDFVPEWQPNPKHEPEPEVPADDKTSAPEATDGELTQRAEGEVLLGFVHLQFCLSEGTPLLCVLNMQMLPAAMGRGLGKFALQLVELMARQLSLELVMLYMKNGKVSTVRLSRDTQLADKNAAAKAAAAKAAAATAKRVSTPEASPQSVLSLTGPADVPDFSLGGNESLDDPRPPPTLAKEAASEGEFELVKEVATKLTPPTEEGVGLTRASSWPSLGPMMRQLVSAVPRMSS